MIRELSIWGDDRAPINRSIFTIMFHPCLNGSTPVCMVVDVRFFKKKQLECEDRTILIQFQVLQKRNLDGIQTRQFRWRSVVHRSVAPFHLILTCGLNSANISPIEKPRRHLSSARAFGFAFRYNLPMQAYINSFPSSSGPNNRKVCASSPLAASTATFFFQRVERHSVASTPGMHVSL